MPFKKGDRRHKGKKLSVEHRQRIGEANRTWLTGLEVARKGLCILIPPRCVCGNNDYRYSIEMDVVRARCNLCEYDRYFYAKLGYWSMYGE